MKTTKFERFARRIFFLTGTVFIFVFVGLSGFEYFYNINCQSIENEIEDIEASIDSLTMEVQELGSFERLSEIAVANGYTYQSDATAARYTSTSEVVQ
ncbi:hypothetical protein [Tannockella kyphosi]|uniref:hypothetical protein n=1 Tax=Tannockella kyphosi TaxID=2899121 RepID=UPI002013A5A1|nr:hypothetical protein [Tannockella kyphosi]